MSKKHINSQNHNLIKLLIKQKLEQFILKSLNLEGKLDIARLNLHPENLHEVLKLIIRLSELIH